MSLIQKLFRRTPQPKGADVEFLQFASSFRMPSGELFLDFLAREKVTNLSQWLSATPPEPEPKMFIGMANDATRRGLDIWKQTIIYMHLEEPHDPSQLSRDALSVLSQILEIPIVLYYREGADTELMRLEFQP